MSRRLPALAAALTLLAGRAAAQATPEVSPLDAAYRHVELLAAVGLADTVLVGQRPYSRREIARVAAAARRTAARWERELAAAATPRLAARLAAGRAALAALEGEYALDIAAVESRTAAAPRARALDALAADVTATNAVQRATPGTELGTSDAAVAPLAEYREGRPIVRGATTFVESAHWGAARWIAASARLRVRLAPGDAAAANARWPRAQALALHDAQLRLVAGPWALTAGRVALAWGQGAHGGPLLSSNAPPLDLVMLSTDVPIRVPLVHRLLGPVKGAAFLAELGERQRFPGGNLSGFRLSAHPFGLTRWELGAGTVNQWGGSGAPHASFGKRLLDQLVIVDSFGGTRDIQVSNKVAGLDTRLRFPSLGGLSAYYEVQFDDFDLARVGSVFREDAAHVLGARAAALGADGRWELGVEGRRTGLRLYQHSDFTTGLAYDRRFLGDPLGPQARAAYLRAGRRAGGGGAWLDLAAERRRNDQYVSTDVPPPFHFVPRETRPAETRLRAVASFESAARGRRGAVSVLGQLGVERVTGFAFAAGETRTNALARLGLEYRP